jgi:hypothetical protein
MLNLVSNIVAYIGIDNFDNILYLSRILSKLGKKVLVMDHSESLSVQYSIPQPRGMDCRKEIITYRKVDFTTQEINQAMREEYDDILIYCGFQKKDSDIACCNRIIFVTDLYRYNCARITDTSMVCDASNKIEQELLIKDAAPIKITPDILVERMGLSIPSEHISILYHDERDYTNGLVYHYNGSFRLKGISKARKKYLLEEVKKLHPEINFNQTKTAYRRARRREGK